MPNKVNKTQAVREYLKDHGGASTQEVVEALAKKGVSISANYVSNIKATSKTRRRRVRRAAAKRGVGIVEIKAALALLKLTGSIAGAEMALAAAQEIRELL